MHNLKREQINTNAKFETCIDYDQWLRYKTKMT